MQLVVDVDWATKCHCNVRVWWFSWFWPSSEQRLTHTHTLHFSGHFSRWTWVSRCPLNSPSIKFCPCWIRGNWSKVLVARCPTSHQSTGITSWTSSFLLLLRLPNRGRDVTPLRWLTDASTRRANADSTGLIAQGVTGERTTYFHEHVDSCKQLSIDCQPTVQLVTGLCN